ncbi:MAG: regulatory protein RecX [Clostridia bacterium]|nr:regulatory protein RecX [Clostridia bacterium]
MKLTSKKGKGQKLHIYIDDDYKFTTDINTFYLLGLQENEEIDEEKLIFIKDKIDFSYLYNCAVKILSLRANSEKELRDKLIKKNRREYVVEEVISKIKEQGYLNDEDFAKAYSKELIQKKGKSKNYVSFKLREKGINNSMIDEVLEDYNIDEKERIEDIIQRKYKKVNLNDEKEKRRIYNFFVRAGFKTGDILTVFNKIVGE